MTDQYCEPCSRGVRQRRDEHPLSKRLAMHHTDFLFVIPGFIQGAGSTIDLFGTAEDGNYNISRTPAEADAKAMANDWLVVGQDIAQAAAQAEEEAEAAA